MKADAASALAGALGVAVVDLVPSVAAIGRLRTTAFPRLSGNRAPGRLAITIDDGPHPVTTPKMLAALAECRVRASFFVLGERLQRWPEVGRQLVAEGHDVGLHGWQHGVALLRTPIGVRADLVRGHRYVHEVTGRRPQFWRPPHGIPTATGLLVARRLGMTPTLWTADGRDWRDDATAESVRRRVIAQFGDGGVVLLHDGAGPGAASSAALGALPGIVEAARARGWQVGALSDLESGAV